MSGIGVLFALVCLEGCALPDAFRLPSTRRLASRAEQLEADLRRAEYDLRAAEEHLRSRPARAVAVSSLAEARIQVDNAAQRAPWRKNDIALARERLGDADREMSERHYGAALFFADRARRIADRIREAARQAALEAAQ